MKRHCLLLIIILIAINGCGIYRRCPKPGTTFCTDSLYRSCAMTADSVSAADSSTVAALSWRELFADSCLQRLIAAGLEKNSDLEIARLKLEEADAALMHARLSYLPALTLNATSGVSSSDEAGALTGSIVAEASWEVDLFGRVTNALWQAQASVEQQQAYVQAVQTGLVAGIAESYYTLLLLDEQLRISEETLVNWNETIKTLEALVLVGKSNDVAVHQAKANRAALEASAETIRKSIFETENALCALLKETPHTIERSTLDTQMFPEEISAGVPVQMLSRRPDVKEAEAGLAKAFYATNAARSAFYPKITLSGALGWNGTDGPVLDPGAWIGNALASLAAPLFNAGTNVANLKIAQAQQKEAALEFEQTVLEAGNEVNEALAAWQTADRRIGLDLDRIRELEAATEKTELLVRYSTANYLEVLVAQQSLLDARMGLAQDRIGKILAVISLYHALGGGID